MSRREALAALLVAFALIAAGMTWLFGPFGLIGAGLTLAAAVTFGINVEERRGEPVADPPRAGDAVQRR